uniref:Uncharacterized protein n=1 Tax=Arundo donax TaxID=35708 RepID=A0A0A9GND8_ARUDO
MSCKMQQCHFITKLHVSSISLLNSMYNFLIGKLG